MALLPAMSDAMGASAAPKDPPHRRPLPSTDHRSPARGAPEKTEMPLEGARRLSVSGAALRQRL